MSSARQRSTSETESTIRPARWRSVRTTSRRRGRLVVERRHVEAAALVDHRQHLAAQVDHAFEELRRLGQARDLVGHARHLVDGLDRQAELVVAQAEDDELPLLAALGCGSSALPALRPERRTCGLNRCMTSSRNSCSGDSIETSRRPPSPR